MSAITSRTPESMYIPPAIVPPFAKKIGEAAARMNYADAVVDVFRDANIHFEVEGDLSSAHEHGLVIASDHRHRIEPLLAQALMSKSGRDSSHVIAMPTSFAGRLIQSSGSKGQELIIPIVPGINTVDSRVSWRHPKEAYRQRRYPHVLSLTKEATREINNQALKKASHHASAGGAVTIFPTGDTVEAANASWQRGLGRLVQQVPAEAWDSTELAVLRADAFPLKKVLSSLALRDLGIRPRKQTVVMRAARLGTINEYAPHLAAEGQEAAQRISDMIHESYKARFQGIEDHRTNVSLLGHDVQPVLANIK